MRFGLTRRITIGWLLDAATSVRDRRGSMLLSAIAGLHSAALVLVGTIGAAQATTSFYYSTPQNIYSWCADSNYAASENCARAECLKSGGSDCQLVLECFGGWGAVAFPQDDTVDGVGMTCQRCSAGYAREAALAWCVQATNDVSWTDNAFDGSGNQTTNQDNGTGDLTFYVQFMLNVLHYNPGSDDGVAGPATRAAIEAFETQMSLPVDGQVSEQLFSVLVDAVGGPEVLASEIKYDPAVVPDANIDYAEAASPAPDVSFENALAARSQTDRLTVLATMLDAAKFPCTRPAIAASEVMDGWAVTCREGAYVVLVENHDHITIARDALAGPEFSPGAPSQAPAASNTPTPDQLRTMSPKDLQAALARIVLANGHSCTLGAPLQTRRRERTRMYRAGGAWYAERASIFFSGT